MMRTLTLVFAVSLASLHAPAQEGAAPGKGAPEAKVDTSQSGQGGEKFVEGKGAGGNSWFKHTDLDLGTHHSQDVVVGRFPFHNPNDAAIEWRNLQGSCQCSTAEITVGQERYRYVKKPNPGIKHVLLEDGKEREEPVQIIAIPPGASGEVEVHMELGGVTGPRSATLDIHTTDTLLPMVKLKWGATGAQVFITTPSEVNLNQMVWSETRTFTVTVQSPVQKDWNILGHEDVKDFTVRYDKSLNDQGIATWTIAGSYSPTNAEALGGGLLRFYTDVPGQAQISVRVSAAILGPLEVKPGTFLTLGMIRKGQKRSERVVFEPNDSTDLEAKEVRLENLTVASEFVAAKTSKDGRKLIVELEISPQAPPGLLRGDLVVELNHPAVPNKKILFNGFVR